MVSNKNQKRAWTVGAVGLLALAAVVPLAACDSDDDTTPGTTSPTATTPPTGTTPPGTTLPGTSGPTDSDTNAFVHPAGGDLDNGKKVFRFETFGNEGYWTAVLQLPQGMKEAGVTPLQAIALGISVDIDAVPAAMQTVIANELKTDLSPANAPNLNNPATTEALIELNAIIGVAAKGVTTPNGTLDIDPNNVFAGESIGITCAFCHSISDGSVYKPAAGAHGGTIGHRVDGPTNHDLQVGKAVAAAKHSRAFYPTLALDLAANAHGSVSRKGKGVGLISANATEAEVDAYLSDDVLYPVGMFDDGVDGNGAPMHITPFFRTDLAAPWGSEGSIQQLQNFNNLVYTALLDPTDLLSTGGTKFLTERGGAAAATEIATNYAAILSDLGIPAGGTNGYPFVGRAGKSDVTIGLPAGAKVEDSPIGMKVDATKMTDMDSYLNSLAAPAGVKTDAAAIAAGRNVFRQSCTGCHRDDQSKFVPQGIVAYNANVDLYANTPKRGDLWPAWNGVTVADRTAAGLAPVRNFDGTFDDKLIIIEASDHDLPRGSALPLLMDLARKPTFLHDDSVPSLDNLLDASRGATAVHPFYVADDTQRAQLVAFLNSLDDKPLSSP